MKNELMMKLSLSLFLKLIQKISKFYKSFSVLHNILKSLNPEICSLQISIGLWRPKKRTLNKV